MDWLIYGFRVRKASGSTQAPFPSAYVGVEEDGRWSCTLSGLFQALNQILASLTRMASSASLPEPRRPAYRRRGEDVEGRALQGQELGSEGLRGAGPSQSLADPPHVDDLRSKTFRINNQALGEAQGYRGRESRQHTTGRRQGRGSPQPCPTSDQVDATKMCNIWGQTSRLLHWAGLEI